MRLRVQNTHKLLAADGLLFVQVLGDLVQLALVVSQQLIGLSMLGLHDLHDLGIHLRCGLLTAGKAGIAAQIGVVHRLERDHVKILGHAVAGDQRAGQLGGLLNIVAGTCGDGVEDQLLSGAAAGQGGNLVQDLLLGHQGVVTVLDLHRKAQRAGGTRHDGDLLHGGAVRLQCRHQRMADLMVGDDIFVARKSEVLLCAQYQPVIQETLGIRIYGEIREFAQLFELLMQHSQKENFTLIIDEFQEFLYINPSIVSDIQRIWDQYHATSKINFIVCGSVYSMMKRIFEDRKEPLYGRLTARIALHPFTTTVIKEILADHAPQFTSEDLLCLYLLTGGVAKYITLLMEAKAFNKTAMINYALSEGSPFLTEGKDMLISEFGKDYANYFSILSLIAEGKTTQREIDSIINKNTGSYLANLEDEYSLIKKVKPMFAKPNSRATRYCLQDNFLRFWFRFIFSNNAVLEMGKNHLLIEYVEKNYEQYSGLLLEKYFRELIAEEEEVTDVGNYWDKNGENEIDLIALNRFNKTALIGEVKRNPRKISIPALEKKGETLHKELNDYKITFKGFSLKDM